MTLRVGYSDTLLVDPQARDSLDGIGIYTRELRSRLARNPELRVVPVVMGGRAARASAPGTFVFPGCPPIVAARSLLLGTQWPGGKELSPRIDVYLATDYRVPRLRDTPVCATVFDAIPLSHPQWANPHMRRSKNWILRHSIGHADHVLAISHAMVAEIVELYRIPAERISVTPLGIGEDWFVTLDAQRIDRVRDRYALAAGYFLFVGTLQPRKNIARIVEAYSRLPEQVRAAYQLVIVGKVGWSAGDIVELLRESAASGVRWLERVPDDDLHALYQGACAFVFPSLYEGFGLPVIEAFASGAPVITSTVTSLPEVAGDAASLVDPTEVDAIAAAMQRMVDDSQWANDLRARGRLRARVYSWDVCAALTAAALREIVQEMT